MTAATRVSLEQLKLMKVQPVKPRTLKPTDQRLVTHRRPKNRSLFAIRLQEEREKNNLPIGHLADMVGMSKSSISLIERGIQKSVEHPALWRMADIFNVSIDYLLGRSDERSYTPRA